MPNELMDTVLDQQSQITTLRSENARLAEQVTKLEAALATKNREIARRELEVLMLQKNLPEDARRRLRAAFSNATTDSGMRAAVNTELKRARPLTPDLVART